MKKYLEKLRSEFSGSAEDLISMAQDVAKTLSLDQEASEGNERLLRHYVSMGVVDKPAREGRDALYGFRHLVQFVAARRLLAEGLPLAKIAKYTAAVQTDALTTYLEKQNKTSEAELLVAAFRSEVPEKISSSNAPKRSTPPKALPSIATGMGMVDVLHEMRQMEQRVQLQLHEMHHKMRDMVEHTVKSFGEQHGENQMNTEEFKQVVTKLAAMMDEAAQRFDSLLHKPMQMIETQMQQQKYMFDEAHRQKEFLERMFSDLLGEQRNDLRKLFSEQAHHYAAIGTMIEKAHEKTQLQIERLIYDVNNCLKTIELQNQTQPKNHP